MNDQIMDEIIHRMRDIYLRKYLKKVVFAPSKHRRARNVLQQQRLNRNCLTGSATMALTIAMKDPMEGMLVQGIEKD